MDSQPIRSFEDLQCWQACRELRLFVRRDVIPALPKEERFRLSDPLIRPSRPTSNGPATRQRMTGNR